MCDTVAVPPAVPDAAAVQEPLAARIARATAALSLEQLPPEVVEKTRVCLMDLIGCAFESQATVHRARLADVVNASFDEVRARFREAASAALGVQRAAQIEQSIETLEASEDASAMIAALGA